VRLGVLEHLACPRCGGAPLALQASASERALGEAGEHVLEGALDCAACGTSYPITNGIPRLLPEPTAVREDAQRTVERFGQQWNEFDFITEHYNQQFLGWIAPNTLESFAGQVVLEGGCGKGRHSALIAEHGAKDVLAIDLGSAVEAAFRNTRHLPNCHVIQADLFHLPVKREHVDTAFSVGVLHHTVDPRGAFEALATRVKAGGRLIAWIYGRENNEWILRYVDPVRKVLTSRLPHEVVYQLAKVPAALLVAASRGVYRPLSQGLLAPVGRKLFYQAYVNNIAPFPFVEVHSIVHDHLTPPIANYIPRDEFEQWFAGLGLERTTISWHNENSWRGTGYKPSAPRG
jgi:SAM-dependent methyltransferase